MQSAARLAATVTSHPHLVIAVVIIVRAIAFCISKHTFLCVYASSLSVMLLIMALSCCKSVSVNFSSHAVLDDAVSCRIFAPFVGSPRGAERGRAFQ